MKTLLILRHAKSSWSDPSVADFERPLSPRGKRAAPRMGKFLKERGLTPDAILSSTAKRAADTADRVAQHCGFRGRIERLDSLYLASPETYLKVLSELDDAIHRVMIVGHNPGLEDLLEVLTGAGETLPTAALAQVTLNVDNWADLHAGTDSELINVWRPRDLS